MMVHMPSNVMASCSQSLAIEAYTCKKGIMLALPRFVSYFSYFTGPAICKSPENLFWTSPFSGSLD